MTKQQYIIIATHKYLDKLEAEGTPYTRVSKDLDKIWLSKIKEAQERFNENEKKRKKEEQSQQVNLNTDNSIEDQIMQDQKEMMKNIVWDKKNKENDDK